MADGRKTSVSIEFMFHELPFEERVDAAARAGFGGVEFWDWRDKDMDRLAERAHASGVEITGFFGNRLYSLMDPAQHEHNLEGLAESIAVAKRVGCRNLHAFVHEIRPGGLVAPLPREFSEEETFEHVVTGLRKAAELAAEHDVTLLLEAINPLSVPGYWLDHADKCMEVVEAVNHPHLVMLYDFFHQQLSRGNLMATLERCLHRVAAVHVADVPGRHEPGTGEIHFRNVNRKLAELDFRGLLVFEVKPKTDSETAVRAIRETFPEWF